MTRDCDGERLTLLEERYTHLQKHIVEQDKVIHDLAGEIARLRRDVQAWQARALSGGRTGEDDTPLEERPPHY